MARKSAARSSRRTKPAPKPRSNATRRTWISRPLSAPAGRGLFPVDLDVFLAAAVRDRHHYSEPDDDDHSNDRPGRSDARQDPGLPERRENAPDDDQKSDEI